jgi:ribosomal 50S subunit-recycling heat shock protein
LRLDSVISSGFRIGRSLASQYVNAGKAAINGLPCEKADKQIEEGAKITNVIDNRKNVEETPVVPEQKPEEEKKEDDKKDDKDKKDDDKVIFWGDMDNSDTAYKPGESTDEDKAPSISDDNDNEGWSGIYKP